jgi:hypothetical protein
MAEVKFVDGLMAKKPHDKAPEFVKCSLSMKREALIEWLNGQSGEWINADVKESKKGSWYVAVNDYKKADAPDYGEAPPMEGQPF